MKAASAPRWAMSLADLALLLLGFFILLHVGSTEKVRVTDSIQAAFADAPAAPRFEVAAATLFEPGEARLTPRAREELKAIGAGAARSGEHVGIASSGRDAATSRFDGWELAAARVAAVARAIEEGGLEESRIDVRMPSSSNDQEPGGQRISVKLRR